MMIHYLLKNLKEIFKISDGKGVFKVGILSLNFFKKFVKDKINFNLSINKNNKYRKKKL